MSKKVVFLLQPIAYNLHSLSSLILRRTFRYVGWKVDKYYILDTSVWHLSVFWFTLLITRNSRCFITGVYIRSDVESPYLSSLHRGASRMRAGQGIWILKQGILGHFRPLLGIFGANGLFKDTFLFEGRVCIPPPRCAPEKANIYFIFMKIKTSQSGYGS